jgi:hypothetical protein
VSVGGLELGGGGTNGTGSWRRWLLLWSIDSTRRSKLQEAMAGWVRALREWRPADGGRARRVGGDGTRVLGAGRYDDGDDDDDDDGTR